MLFNFKRFRKANEEKFGNDVKIFVKIFNLDTNVYGIGNLIFINLFMICHCWCLTGIFTLFSWSSLLLESRQKKLFQNYFRNEDKVKERRDRRKFLLCNLCHLWTKFHVRVSIILSVKPPQDEVLAIPLNGTHYEFSFAEVSVRILSHLLVCISAPHRIILVKVSLRSLGES